MLYIYVTIICRQTHASIDPYKSLNMQNSFRSIYLRKRILGMYARCLHFILASSAVSTPRVERF